MSFNYINKHDFYFTNFRHKIHQNAVENINTGEIYVIPLKQRILTPIGK